MINQTLLKNSYYLQYNEHLQGSHDNFESSIGCTLNETDDNTEHLQDSVVNDDDLGARLN